MTDHSIDIADSQSHLVLDHAKLRLAATWILDDARVDCASVSIAIVDNDAIWTLNRRYLQHDYPTDVLSFVMESEHHLEGEIVVSAEMAVSQAREFGWQPSDELLLYVIHGMLHLIGFDDQELTEREKMRKKEYDMLALLGTDPAPYIASRASNSSQELSR